MRRWLSSFGNRTREIVSLWALAAAMPAAALGCGGSTSSPGGQAPPNDASTDSETTDTGADAKLEASTDGPECVPKTCSEVGARCGEVPDECGGVVSCGTCGSGEVCGGGGANQCGTAACVAKSCVQLGVECGKVSDGCSKVIECGGCAAPTTCGGGGNPKVCGCKPKNCAQLGAACGTIPDGCGGVLDCGGCVAGMTCGGGGPNQCGTESCKPESCALVGSACGYISDGCSAVLNCGKCSGTDTCGGGGVPNQCGCTPKTCEVFGASCGEVDVGCGKKVDCGGCTLPDTCGGGGLANQCGCACDLPHAQSSCLHGACTVMSCDKGFADCDGQVANGCEADLQSAVNHCGACGTACGYAHASAVCLLGQCTLGNCDLNFENCNGAADDGCEANLKADPANCSACGQTCPSIGGPGVCVAGVCDVTDCTVPFGDCDKSIPGCETDLTVSSFHCGYCGNACSFPNASAACESGSCVIVSCKGSFGDCNGLASDGCEVNLESTVTDCGACAFQCGAPPHALPTCSGGICGQVCETGRGNCDGAPSNGCEIDLATDPNHCGSCAIECPAAEHGAAACEGGFCTLQCLGDWRDCDGNENTGCEVDIAHDPSACGGCDEEPCVAPDTCGGGGVPMQCGCTKTSCTALGAACGTPSDGCGGTLSCGTCGSGLSCVGGKCVESTTSLFFNLRPVGGNPEFHRALPVPGASQLQTLDVGGVKSNPLISPDGTHLLYMSNGTVWIRNLLVGTETNLGVEANGVFAWHPSGNRFLYAVFIACQDGISEASISFVPSPAVMNKTEVVPMVSMRPALEGAYSPDGARLAMNLNLSHDCCGGYQHGSIVFGSLLGALPLTDASVTVVANDSHWNTRPTFTADSQEIYWLRAGSVYKRKIDLSAPESVAYTFASPANSGAVIGPPATYAGPYRVAIYDVQKQDILMVTADGTTAALGLPANEGIDALQWQTIH